ncbi:hypothetical protein BJX96DRAFT_144285 [Aspergillus floccosus]
MGKEGRQDPRSQVDDTVFPNRLVEIADAYPTDPIVRWFVVPFARHPFSSIVAVVFLLCGSLITCERWNDGEVCSGRFLSITFYMSLGFMFLICYSGYLRRKLARQRQLSQDV